MTIKRLFVAAEIPADIIENIVRLRNSIFGNANVKWEPVTKFHLTLKFLGDTEISLIPEIRNMLGEMFKDKNRIPTSFTRFGAFYRNGKPKILWAGFEATLPLLTLKEEIENAFFNFGFEKEERKFKPHLTLARLKGYEPNEKILEFRKLNFEKKEFEIGRIILFESKLKPTGSIYSEIKSFELKN